MSPASAHIARLAAFGLLSFILVMDGGPLLPLRLAVVAAHELAHAGAMILTGGRWVALELTVDEGGRSIGQGGWPVLVLNAGYLGAIWSSLALVCLTRLERLGRPLALGLGLVLAAVCLVWLPPGSARASGVLLAVMLAACALLAGARGCAWVVRWLGLYCLGYALFDLARDAGGGAADAEALARITPLPAGAWAALWLVLAGLSLWLARGAIPSPLDPRPSQHPSPGPHL